VRTSLLLSQSIYTDLPGKMTEWGSRVSLNPENIREWSLLVGCFDMRLNNPIRALMCFHKYLAKEVNIGEPSVQSLMFTKEVYKAEILIECGFTTQGLMIAREALQKNLETESKERNTCLYPCTLFMGIAIDINNIDEYSAQLKDIGEENPHFQDEIEWLLSEIPYILKEAQPESYAIESALYTYALSRFMSRGKEHDFDKNFKLMSLGLELLFDANIPEYKNYPLWLKNFYMDSKKMGKQKEYREQLMKWEKEYPFLKEYIREVDA